MNVFVSTNWKLEERGQSEPLLISEISTWPKKNRIFSEFLEYYIFLYSYFWLKNHRFIDLK